MFAIVELLYGTRRKREGKENDSMSTISLNITSVKVEDIICIESC
jgi:hypothetical protein